MWRINYEPLILQKESFDKIIADSNGNEKGWK